MNKFTKIFLHFVQVVVVYTNSVTLAGSLEGLAHPAPDFKYHTIVEPVLVHKISQEIINTTKEPDGFHVEHLLIRLNVDKETFELDLVLNKQLLAEGFVHRYQENGNDKIYRHNEKDADLCDYLGKIRGKNNSRVAISTCEGLNGIIFDGMELHYISSQMISPESGSKHSNLKHFFYSHSNMLAHNKSCDETHPYEQILRYKRNLADSSAIHGPYNADKLSKYVELVLVVDNGEYRKLGSKNQVVQYGKTLINLVNAFYTPLNIFVVLIAIVIWNEGDQILFADGYTTINNFADYRKRKLLKDHPNDNAQLLGQFKLGNSAVGRGFTGAICSVEQSVGVNVDHSKVHGVVAGTIAHELGHNFGMHHDNKDCKCPGRQCIMSAISSWETISDWSSCSLQYLLVSFTHGLDYCLKNKPKNLLLGPVCGNGFVERGEQCDCGLPEYCKNTCCNATSCMLNSNATCASGYCCDLSTCSLKNAGIPCRTADYECDLPEYCTGQSEYCPGNTYKMDTTPCANGEAYCYQGYCRTRTSQCKLLWGFSGRSCEEERYRKNMEGSNYGNCGYNKFGETLMKCQAKDNSCGLLHCRSFIKNPEVGFGTNLHIYYTVSTLSNGTQIPCYTMYGDFNVDMDDPGLVPNGAPCGDGKMCVDQKCRNIKSLRTNWRDCTNKCKNGWCNNLGHCHCKNGFAPPSCESFGPGGSEDSGPASHINETYLGVLELFMVLLGIILVMVLCAMLYYCSRRNDVHESLVARCRSISSAFTRVRKVVPYVLQKCDCSRLFDQEISRNNKPTELSPDNHLISQNKLEIVIQPGVLVSTTNSKVVINSSYITNERENMIVAGSNSQSITPIATISYPQVGKERGKVSTLAKAFENLNFNEKRT